MLVGVGEVDGDGAGGGVGAVARRYCAGVYGLSFESISGSVITLRLKSEKLSHYHCISTAFWECSSGHAEGMTLKILIVVSGLLLDGPLSGACGLQHADGRQ